MSHVQNADGVRQYQNGNYAGAIRRFDDALSNNPRNANGYYNLAATYHRIGKTPGQEQYLKQAEGYYNQCLQLDADHRECYRGLAVLLIEQGRPESAFTLLRGWSDQSLTSAAPRIELARLYEEFGDRDEAEKKLIEAINLEPTNDVALAAKARLDEMRGDYAQAIINYQRSYQHHQRADIANRIASLRTAIGPTSLLSGPGGTRIVDVPRPAPF